MTLLRSLGIGTYAIDTPFLMRSEQRLRKASCFEQREAEYNRIRRNAEQRGMDIRRDYHVVDEYSIYTHADHDKETLERKRKKSFEVVVSMHAGFCPRGRAINRL